jgi:hypothetical protein
VLTLLNRALSKPPPRKEPARLSLGLRSINLEEGLLDVLLAGGEPKGIVSDMTSVTYFDFPERNGIIYKSGI